MPSNSKLPLERLVPPDQKIILAFAGICVILQDAPMNSNPVSSDLATPVSLSSRLFSFTQTKRFKIGLWLGLLCLLLSGAIFIEIQTSMLQSWVFTRTNEQLSYRLEAGRSTSIAFPFGSF